MQRKERLNQRIHGDRRAEAYDQVASSAARDPEKWNETKWNEIYFFVKPLEGSNNIIATMRRGSHDNGAEFISA